jgi:hypothetical protein
MALQPKVWIYFLLLSAIFTIGFISIKKEILDEINSKDSESVAFRQLSEQLKKLDKNLEQLAVQQKQMQKKSLQQEGELTALKQELGTTAYSENTQVEDEVFSEQRIQQEDAEEKIRVDQMMSNLESYWQNDQAISGESRISETSLLEGFSQVKEGTDVIDVGCKSNICKLELQQTAEATLADNNQLDEILVDSTIFTRSFPNSDGSQRVIMYITQGENELAEITE